jgi:predicted dinucleotide-binding enzyme
VVIDTMNYYPQRDGQVSALDDGSTTSSELLQAHLPQSHVVKGFNNIFFQHLRDLARPASAAGSDERSTLAIAGDDADADAKQTVRQSFDALGYDTLDLGPLAEGWRTQPGQPAYGTQYALDANDWAAGARRVGSDELAGLAMRATREA